MLWDNMPVSFILMIVRVSSVVNTGSFQSLVIEILSFNYLRFRVFHVKWNVFFLWNEEVSILIWTKLKFMFQCLVFYYFFLKTFDIVESYYTYAIWMQPNHKYAMVIIPYKINVDIVSRSQRGHRLSVELHREVQRKRIHL